MLRKIINRIAKAEPVASTYLKCLMVPFDEITEAPFTTDLNLITWFKI
jgi:hypothetical protein